MEVSKTAEVITRLKAVREASGLSIAEISRRVSASGGYVSETTVRRVFSDGSEEAGFNYDSSIRPIAEALLSEDAGSARDNALLSIIGLKNAQIDAMRKQFESRCEEYRSRIEFLRGQIEKKDEYMGKKDAIIERLLDELHPPKSKEENSNGIQE